MFGNNAEHTSFLPGSLTLAPAKMAGLQQGWKTSLRTGLASSPTVVGGVLYFGGWNGQFYAINSSDGNVLWQQYVGKATAPEDAHCFQAIGVSAQPVVAGDVVYVGGGDSAVYALQRNTGEIIWRVSLADPASGAYLWSSITLYNNALYIGVSSLGDCPLVRGALVRIDLEDSGNPLIRYLVPETEIGGGVWSTPAIDAATNTIIVTTGTGEQDVEKGIWGGTLLTLDATTLDIKQHYFLPTNSLEEDIEWGSSPTLFSTADGERMVAAAGKDGVLYALRLSDLSVVWQTKIAIQCVCPECGCGSLSTPAFDGTTLFAGAGVSDPEGFEEGTVYAINPDTGDVVWRRPTIGTLIAPVTVAGQMVFAAGTHGLEIYSAVDGTPVWNDGKYAPLYSQAVVTGDSIYCTYVSGDVVAWRLADTIQ
jgi:polyvinyl alcohol dehydrogenase (cytochrome)